MIDKVLQLLRQEGEGIGAFSMFLPDSQSSRF